MTVMILYASVEGHTRRIAEFIEGNLRDAGHAVRSIDGGVKGTKVSFDGVDKVILAASVHRKRHPDVFERLLASVKDDLARHPTLFISVSLCAGFPEGLDEAQTYLDATCERAGIAPDAQLLTGGAIQLDKYKEYEAWVVRIIGLQMERYDEFQEDRDLTDWTAVRAAVSAFAG